MKALTLTLVSIVFLISCGTIKVNAPPETVELLRGHWNLIELYGQPVPPANKQPHMILNQEEKRVTGNGSCNSFFSSFENTVASNITFSNIGSTKMACSNMDVEKKFFQVLDRARRYSVSGDTLSLSTEWPTVIARFVVVRDK